MAEKGDKPKEGNPADKKGITNPNYRGKAENFDPNFKRGDKKPAPKQQPKKPAAPTASKLPGPSNTAGMKNPTPTRDEPIWKDSVFGPEISIRETNSRTTFTPSCASFIAVCNDTWSSMRINETQIDKQMLVEGYRYYWVAILWLRILQLKRANSFTLTDEETMILDLVEKATLNVPEPLFLYIKSLGLIETSSTGQTLIPTFPNIPNQAIGGFGGYWGAIALDNANQYEEIPTLGVAAAGIRAAVGVHAAGRYDSALDVGDAENENQILVNANLLGFEPLVNRRDEARNFFLNLGIQENEFPNTVENTAFSYALLHQMNSWLATTKTFKMQTVSFDTIGRNVSQAQALIQRPIPAADTRCINGEVRSTSLFKATTNEYGIGYFTLSQLFKEPAPGAANLSVRSQTWTCQNYTGADAATIIPAERVAQRNARRNLPDEYAALRFESLSQRISDWRRRTIDHLILVKQ